MKVKRIFAPDMRQAMRRAREEIGPDAVIVSNHRVAGGVEVVAAHEHEFEAAQAEFKREYEKKKRKDDQVSILTADRSRLELDEELKKARLRIAEISEKTEKEPSYQAEGKRNLQIEQDDDDDLQTILESLKTRQKARRDEYIDDDDDQPEEVTRSEFTASSGNAAMEHMQQEIQQLKSLLEQQIQAPSRKIWVEESPQRKAAEPSAVEGKLAKRFERMGLSDALISQLTRGLESGLDIAKAWRITLSKLTDAVPVMSEDYIDRGGMIAFVGPTGVGKTTSIGKLAARYVLQHGSAGLAMVTTDTYRIAAHEQLRTFGRILDVPVRVVDENNSLDDVLLSLRGKRLVLIDTAGMSQHEGPSEAQKAMLTNVSVRLKKLLVLSCSSQRQVLEDAYDNYQSIGLNGCVLSKLDESGSLGEALTLVVEKALPIAYVTDGQKVPDDIEVAQRNDLVSRAVVTAQKTLERERARALSATGGGSALSSAG
ncbi:flagellar biosynthesis protein FlhF [Neptunomonas antarctica]|uniref:Flagellar biosynthesis protein FlhF n=1 Tax=Neptunomonas antarctica TaxID=619304 RepID=A0A1N7JCQ6_9GAMM|nr:flagellar biosynthesis protein FlhF [Neptunomonas antarctica]SIS47031.1 flagellar biosynthesis protein FlhF [Neptunomonas antarctica]